MKTRVPLFMLVSVLLMLAIALPASAAEAPGIVTNGGFEAPLAGSGWSVSGAVGDKRICNAPAPMPAEGQCMFRFKGGAGTTTLTHIVSPSGLQIIENAAACQNQAVGSEMYIYSVGAAALGTKVTLKVKLTHDGATYNLKMVDRILDGMPNAWDMWSKGKFWAPAGTEVNKVVLSVTHNAPKGKMYVDHVRILTEPLGPPIC